MASNVPTPTTPRLLTLAAELRNRIYTLVLIAPADQPITINQGLREPPLLQTCRQIQHETKPIYYGDNTFKAEEALYCAHKRHGHGTLLIHRLQAKPEAGDNASTLFAWLRAIGKDKTSLIRRLLLEHGDVTRDAEECYVEGAMEIKFGGVAAERCAADVAKKMTTVLRSLGVDLTSVVPTARGHLGWLFDEYPGGFEACWIAQMEKFIEKAKRMKK